MPVPLRTLSNDVCRPRRQQAGRFESESAESGRLTSEKPNSARRRMAHNRRNAHRTPCPQAPQAEVEANESSPLVPRSDPWLRSSRASCDLEETSAENNERKAYSCVLNAGLPWASLRRRVSGHRGIGSEHPRTAIGAPDRVQNENRHADWSRVAFEQRNSTSTWMENFVLAYIVSVTAFQAHENHR